MRYYFYLLSYHAGASIRLEGSSSQTIRAEDVGWGLMRQGYVWTGRVVIALLAFVVFGCATGRRAGKATQASRHKIFLWQATHDQNPKSALTIYGVLPASLRGHGKYDLAVKRAFHKADAMALELGYSTPRQNVGQHGHSRHQAARPLDQGLVLLSGPLVRLLRADAHKQDHKVGRREQQAAAAASRVTGLLHSHPGSENLYSKTCHCKVPFDPRMKVEDCVKEQQ